LRKKEKALIDEIPEQRGVFLSGLFCQLRQSGPCRIQGFLDSRIFHGSTKDLSVHRREELGTEVLIIGGGIVGTSLAYELARYELEVVLVEKEAELSFGVSKSNSGIVHTGFQDDPQSLKARLTVRGNRLYGEMSKLLDFPFIPTGEMVVAFPGEREVLERLKENGEILGIPGLEIVDRTWIREHEPNLSSEIEYALLGPTAAVINPYEAIYAMAENAASNGVKIYCDKEITSIAKKQDGWKVKTANSEYTARYVINAAGLWADSVSQMAGIRAPRIIPWKGEEFILDRHADRLTKNIIFPIPSRETKGILVIPTVDGNTMIGPTAEEIEDKEDLTTSKAGKKKVLESVKRIVPCVREDQIIASFAGLRPSIAENEFYIRDEGDGFVNIVGIKSPGLTAAPAIAEYVKDMLASKISLSPRHGYIATRRAIPRFRHLTSEERNRLIKKDPEYGEVVCRCELVTKSEIREAVKRGARCLDGIKFRTRSQMGRCHGAFCTMKITAIMAEELGVAYDQITKRGKGSELAVHIS
jgi:glycerol-3-phosphate dehydrogenase